MAERILSVICYVAVIHSVSAAFQEKFFPYGDGNRDNYIQQANDVSSPEVRLRFGFPFYNEKYWSLYVNDNGIISFNNPYTKYERAQPALPIGPDTEDPNNVLGTVFIAPFWANVDMTERGYVYYRQTSEQASVDRAKDYISTGFVQYSDFIPKELVIATWLEVGFYGDTGGRNKRNSFQCVVATDEIETFVIFIYDDIQWTTGVESNGRPDTGIGGTPAQVGFNAGDGSRYMAHQFSRDVNFLFNLEIESNIQDPGVWVYYVSSESVEIGGCTSAGKVTTYPRFDTMLGQSNLFLQGPCFKSEDVIWVRWGDENDPLHVKNCTFISQQIAHCHTPRFYQIGSIPFQVSNDDMRSFPYEGTFSVVDIGDVPPEIKRVDPQGWQWQVDDRQCTLTWDVKSFDYYWINIELLGYSEIDGEANWEPLTALEMGIPNTGTYTFYAQGYNGITEENPVGVFRITRLDNRAENAIWSDVHYMGYMMDDKYQRSPVRWSNLRCEEWAEQEAAAPVWNYEFDLPPCPCNLRQAIADQARFRPLQECNMDNAGLDDRNDYCYLREGIKHCVINIINSPQTADSTCCYDFEENLVYAGDSFSGSFSRRVTVNGVPPYNVAKKVPKLSSWYHDIIPYYFCCVHGDLCEIYREYRPTRDCRWYDPPRMAVVFGDPHFVTFDGVEYTFNGKGEWILFRSTTGAQNRFLLQGRTEQMLDWQGNVIQATRLTSVVMKEEDRDNIEIQFSPRTVLQVVYRSSYLKVDRQSRMVLDGFHLTFPKFETNLTQVIVTFQDSEIGVVINGTADGLFIQVVIPDEFKGYVEGLLGNWNDDPDDDLTSNGGTIVSPNATTEVIYNQFGKTWEISTVESLFLYTKGKNHKYYQDSDFVPSFDPPNSNLPPSLNSRDIDEVCAGNRFCIYDVQSTGNILFGQATRKAYEDYRAAESALRKVTTCQYIKSPMNGTKAFLRERNHDVGSEIEFSCDEDFIPVGPEYRVCQEGGDWSGGQSEDEIINDCVESLVCGGLRTPPHGSITMVDEHPESLEVSYSCDVGYRRFGRQYRHCRQEYERWSGYRPGCYQKMTPLEMGAAVVCSVVAAILLVAFTLCIFHRTAKRDRQDREMEREKEMFRDIQISNEEKPKVRYGQPSGGATSLIAATSNVQQHQPFSVDNDPNANMGYASETWA